MSCLFGDNVRDLDLFCSLLLCTMLVASECVSDDSLRNLLGWNYRLMLLFGRLCCWLVASGWLALMRLALVLYSFLYCLWRFTVVVTELACYLGLLSFRDDIIIVSISWLLVILFLLFLVINLLCLLMCLSLFLMLISIFSNLLFFMWIFSISFVWLIY